MKILDITARLEQKKKQMELQQDKERFMEVWAYARPEEKDAIREALKRNDRETFMELIMPVSARMIISTLNRKGETT